MKTFFDLNSGGIYGPQNGKCKYYSNDKTNYRFVISMTENTVLFYPVLKLLVYL